MSLSLAGDGTITGIDPDASDLVSALGGIGSNVVSTETNTNTTTTSNTFVNTSCAATITPTSASSKILVLVSIAALRVDGTGRQLFVGLYRGDVTGTQLMDEVATTISGAGSIQAPGQAVYLDSPATTSSTTYTIALRSSVSGQSVQINDDQIMTLIEVAA